MSDNNDILSREIVIAGKLAENGVSVQVKSRAVAAMDRLLGSLADIPTAFAEGVASKKRVKTQIEERLLVAKAELAERKLMGIPSAADALLFDMMKEAGRKQINAAGVAVHTVEELKAFPSPSEQTQKEQTDPQEAVDEDWFNQFVRYAEDASSENLQQLWGRVLAGEINSPGRFSRHTLRFMAELDKETAQNCEFAAEYIVTDFIPHSNFWMENKPFMIAIDLARLGLIEGAAGKSPNRSFTIGPEGCFFQENGQHAIVCKGPVGTKFNVKAMPLTRLGIEVFSLLAVKDETTSLRTLAKILEKQSVDEIQLGTFEPEINGIRFFESEVLFVRGT